MGCAPTTPSGPASRRPSGATCVACGNDVWNRFVVDDMYWREETWGDERDIQCPFSEDGRHHPEEEKS